MAGVVQDELRSVTGHQSRDVLSIYVRPTDKLAATGINKRFDNMEFQCIHTKSSTKLLNEHKDRNLIEGSQKRIKFLS